MTELLQQPTLDFNELERPSEDRPNRVGKKAVELVTKNTAFEQQIWSDRRDIANKFSIATLSDMSKARVEAYKSSVDENFDNQLADYISNPKILKKPSAIEYALANYDDSWMPQFKLAAEAGVFYWTAEKRGRLNEKDRRLLDRMLFPLLEKFENSDPAGILRLHKGDLIFGSSIEKRYRKTDGSMPSDTERDEYASSLDSLKEYTHGVYRNIYGETKAANVGAAVMPNELAVRVDDRGKLRIDRK